MDRDLLYSETPISGFPAEKLFTVARAKLLSSKVFFGKLAMRCRPRPTLGVPTACVDAYGRLYYNPKFFNAMDKDTACWAVAHEVMHLVQKCHQRMPKKAHPDLWNAAADIVVNQLLEEMKIVPKEEWRHLFYGYRPEHQKYRGWYTEKIYYDLLKQHAETHPCPACRQIFKTLQEEHERQKERKQGDSQEEKQEGAGAGLDGEGDPFAGQEMPEHTCENPQGCCGGFAATQDDDRTREKWTRYVLGAAEGCGRGDIPGAVKEMLDELRKPTVRWQDLIRTTAQSVFGKGRYTWKRRSRRSIGMGVTLPARQPDGLGALVFIDSSVSITKDMKIQFVSECVGIIEQTGCDKILLGLHDVNVYELLEVSAASIRTLELREGGTSHIDVFNVANGHKGVEGVELPKGYKVGLVVCFTDMMSLFPDQTPTYPVIWAIPSQYYGSEYAKEPGFGRSVEVEINGRG